MLLVYSSFEKQLSIVLLKLTLLHILKPSPISLYTVAPIFLLIYSKKV